MTFASLLSGIICGYNAPALALSDGAAVATLPDVYGPHGYDAAQATAGLRPIYDAANGVVNFAAAPSRLDISASALSTVSGASPKLTAGLRLIVTSLGGYQMLLGTNNRQLSIFSEAGDGSSVYYGFGDTAGGGQSCALSPALGTSLCNLTWDYDGATARFFINGAQVGSHASSGANFSDVISLGQPAGGGAGNACAKLVRFVLWANTGMDHAALSALLTSGETATASTGIAPIIHHHRNLQI